MSDSEPQQQPGEPFAVSLSRGRHGRVSLALHTWLSLSLSLFFSFLISVTHGDVKKQNLTRDAQGHLYVIDLGCAKNEHVSPDDRCMGSRNGT